ncbi:hypothetical protein U1Q18_050086 [Sarracenia purpurea var. burkii]
METKSSRKERERDRGPVEEHRDSSKDHRHRSSKHKSRDADDHHHHHASDEKHRSKHEKNRDRGGDDNHRSRDEKDERRRSREYSQDRERSHEPKAERGSSRDWAYHDYRDNRESSYEREGSRDRAHDRDKRERSHEREGSRDGVLRDESVERRHSSSSHKRKERGEREDRLDGSEKRARVSDEVKEERKEKRRFEDRVADGVSEFNGRDREERRDRKRFEDGVKDTESRDTTVNSRVEKRERRTFGDRMKKEDMDADEDDKLGIFDDKMVKKEPKDELFDSDQAVAAPYRSGSPDNVMASRKLPETSVVPSHFRPTKVSSISTPHENKGVSITGSHEVPGKSSTDGTASAGKSGNLSLDALAKAKRALQMQKELAEKLKKLPLSNKSSSSEGIPDWEPKEVIKTPFSSAGLLPTPVSGTALLSAAAASAMAPQEGLSAPNFEAVKRAQELAAKMGFRQDPQFAPLINLFPGQMPPVVTFQPKPAKAPVLRLDALGREVDEHGNVVNTTKLTNLSTLKVNINKQKKEAFQILKPELDVDPDKNPHFDPRMGIDTKKLLRPKRTNFQFVEEGKWSKEAEIIKLKVFVMTCCPPFLVSDFYGFDWCCH